MFDERRKAQYVVHSCEQMRGWLSGKSAEFLECESYRDASVASTRIKSDLSSFVLSSKQSSLCLREEYLYTFICSNPSLTIKILPNPLALYNTCSISPTKFKISPDKTLKFFYRALRCSKKWPHHGCFCSVALLLLSRDLQLPLLHRRHTQFYPRDLSINVPISGKTSLKHAGRS